ncbi:DUF4007 family protein [Nitratireductor sp. ZSWI3]|uniref:DUF4007 family protein n=1 Tax=Nitratireductor sp. ZSWI3 TaxID=2966359 RepID=UPI002150304D|nr:DUF4007 family protein [Nitratireductor sp. ZSWI3]MCR4266773.1 DUF4007 family protein [Nitratireductor sp. ZSWI3]
MSRGPLFAPDYRPQFSGHETFPLKYGWLKKAVDAVLENESISNNRTIFLGDDAIGKFGVGKNMVTSIRFWAEAADMISSADADGHISVTPLGNALFGNGGWDPFMESPTTAWIAHWNLAGRPMRTTWYWAFGHLPFVNFDRDLLLRSVLAAAKEAPGWMRISEPTVKRDVDCLVRSYCPKYKSSKSSHEDDLESPLVELGLIRPTGKKDGFRMVRGAKPTLGAGAFVFALIDFWDRYAGGAALRNTLSFEAIAHEPGSPGRVFLLEESDLVDRLSELEDATNGALQWSETAGLKQVIRRRAIDQVEALTILGHDYDTDIVRRVA